MSGSVDVLAVLDDAREMLRTSRRQMKDGCALHDAVAVARAAVAELIDALGCARAELSALNSAYGAESVDRVIDRCGVALFNAGVVS